MKIDINFLKKCYKEYIMRKEHFAEIERYYYGNTDSLKDFTPIQGRSNLKLKINFEQKLIDRESQYSFANDITYTSLTNSDDAVKDIAVGFANLKVDHDINLGTELIKFGEAYEINYIKNKKLYSRIVTPLNGYPVLDANGDIIVFLHIFKQQFSDEIYIDVYDDRFIYHFKGENFEEARPAEYHNFLSCPVGVGLIGGRMYSNSLGYEVGDKTIHRTIKTIQDALETNLSDICCEISDFRNSILKMKNLEPDYDENGNIKNPVIRNNSFLWCPENADAEWLIKNINDTFIKNTRDDIIKLIYTLTSHIDDNAEIASNVSGIALRSRLTQLESKCKNNERAMTNILKTRIKCLFRILDLYESKKYDENLIKVSYTPCIPIDETAIADIISKIDHDIVSNETKRSWLPRISNVAAESDKIKKENAEAYLLGLDDGLNE